MTKKYTTRTCVECGLRAPQPEMIQKEIKYKSGNSRRGVTGSTWLGAWAGDKASGRAIKQSLFNTQQREYYRKRKVWMCPDCAGTHRNEKQSNGNGWGWLALVVFIILLVTL